MQKMISLIIPALNEETTVNKLLNSFFYDKNLEVIIVDGASTDRTVEFARRFPVKVVECGKGRALQMNAAAEVARGDIFVFLHCDCLLEEGSLEAITDILNKGYIGGCLIHKIISNQPIYRFIEASGNIRARLSKIFYGDQAIFVRRDVFFKAGGFDRIGLFEDALFSKKLKKIGKTIILDKKVYTSSRRWEKQGLIKTTLLHWILTIGFLCGISTHLLEKLYSDIR